MKPICLSFMNKLFISIILLALSLAVQAQEYFVEAIVGGRGAENVPANTVSISKSNAIAVDAQGHIYIADTENNRIRKVDTKTGIIKTIAGDGRRVNLGDGNLAVQASLNYPQGIAVDSQGNIYIACGYRVRKVDANTGIITTIAGDDVWGYLNDGGLATKARFRTINALAVDSEDNLYICDQRNGRIRKINKTSGIISTFAGNGNIYAASGDGDLAVNAGVGIVKGIALDYQNNLYICGENRIRKVNAITGIISTIAGNGESGFSGDGELAIHSCLYNISHVAVDSSHNIYIADSGNDRIRKIDATTGIINTIAGGGHRNRLYPDVLAKQAQLYFPTNVALDHQGYLYLNSNASIRKINLTSGIITTIAGINKFGSSSFVAGYGNGFDGDGGPAINAKVDKPTGLLASDGELLFSDSQNYRIRKIDLKTGIISTVLGNGTSSSVDGDGSLAKNARIGTILGITKDSNNNLYLAGASRIRKIDDSTGIIQTFAGGGNFDFYSKDFGDGGPADSAWLGGTHGIAIDPHGNVFIADTTYSVIRKVDAQTGIINTIVGNRTFGFSGDGGLATQAQLNNPQGLAVDSVGNLYIADANNRRIRRVDAITGIITTIAGNGQFGFSGDGDLATQASLSNVNDIAFDKNGNLYIADGGHNRIRRIDKTTGVITTIAGNGIGGYSKAGIGTQASINNPQAIAIDDNGYIYVSDNSHQILRIVPAIPDVALKVNNITLASGIVQDFGTLSLKESKAITFTIKNRGFAPLYISDLQLTGDFSTSAKIPDTLGIRDSIQIVVHIKSQNAGTKTGRLIVRNNDLYDQNFVINLHGQVAKASQAINYDVSSLKQFQEKEFVLTAQTSSGLPVTYSSADPNIITIQHDSLAIIKGVGTTTLTVTQVGNNNYHPAISITKTIRISKGEQVIDFEKINSKTFGDAIFGLQAKTNSDLKVHFTSSNPSVATVLDNVVTIKGAGITTITARQSGNIYYNPATNVTQELVVLKKPQTLQFDMRKDTLKDFNALPFELNASCSSGLPISFSSTNPEVAIVTGNVVVITGPGKTLITATQTGNSNYLPTSEISYPLRVTIGSVTNLTAEVYGRHSIKLNWDVVLNQVRQTRLERSEGTSDHFVPIFTNNATEYIDTSLSIKPGVTYYYRAITIGDGGDESMPSDTVGVLIPSDEVLTSSPHSFKIKRIKIYPNPSSSGLFTIKSDLMPRTECLLISTQGDVIQQTPYLPHHIDLRHSPQGVYYLIISHKNSKHKIVKKLIRQ